MALAEALLTIYATAVGTASGIKDLQDFLTNRVRVEGLLSELVEDSFQQQMPRLRHLCLHEEPVFNKEQFREALVTRELTIVTPDDLRPSLLPILAESVSAPTAVFVEDDFFPVYESILDSALRGMWKKIAASESLANEILLGQNATLLAQQGDINAQLQKLSADFGSLAEFARTTWQQGYDKLTDTAPPSEHRIGESAYLNPFLLVKAEDFNHNYTKLARLFQDSPEWDSIQRRTDNVFIEGGRGTGKSMLLRRLTAQATLAAKRLEQPTATFDELPVDYFGVYVKLTRGYYEQFSSVDTVDSRAASLLAQHELNIEIFDAFVDTLRWLLSRGALSSLSAQQDGITNDLAGLFSRAPVARSVDDLQKIIVRFEQDQIITYYREKAFCREVSYDGSARDTVSFIRQLSHIFRTRLFPTREIRLFLLIDEFETLLEVQQLAINTVIKMRLPDLSMKIAVRRSGRKTADTFTDGDPIQQPRDYAEVHLDYDINSRDYLALLEGIASKRLQDAGYPEDIRSYLSEPGGEEVPEHELDSELQRMWQSGQRRTEEMNAEFRTKYSTAATYRLLVRKHKKKSFSGFEQYATLSSGITSNFIELCKYAFYFALSDQLPLQQEPSIPSYLQTEAAYRVSQRLLATIDGNVPVFGAVLARMLTDIGSILRSRLLNDSSEPEANRLAIVDFADLSVPVNSRLGDVVDRAIVWSVVHVELAGDSFRPKNAARPPSANLIINRIYCPALGISPRSRWRVNLRVSDLAGLIDPDRREATYQRLMRTLGAVEQPSVSQIPLFSV